MRREFHKRQDWSARVRAITAYINRCYSRFDVPRGPPDLQKSSVELINDKPHAIVRTAEGTTLATYQICSDGRLRYLKPQETTP